MKVISAKTVSILAGKKIGVDAFNWVYQFLTTIRLADGSQLTDRNGKVTSHLNGLFYRCINLLSNNITPIFVFDGKAPKFKKNTLVQREEAKEHARAMAMEAKTVEERAMYMKRASAIDDYIIESSKALLSYMGVPFIQAPAEGEAQASVMNSGGLVYCVASQDYDTLLFGAERVVRNLNVTNRKKIPGKGIRGNVPPEMIEMADYASLGLDREKLVLIGLLVGTDYNSGVQGIGPKKALKLVKKMTKEEILSSFDFGTSSDINEIFSYFISPNVTRLEKLPERKSPDREALLKFLSEEHGFAADRVISSLEKIKISENSLFQYG